MTKAINLSNSGDQKRRQGSLWLFEDDLKCNKSIEDGSIVDLMHEGSFRGRAFFSKQSNIKVRVVSESKITIDENFFRNRIQTCFNNRQNFVGNRLSYRVVNSDSDFLPGLVVDQYNDFLTVQFRHPTIENNRNYILNALEEVLNPRGIYARNDVRERKDSGLEQYKGLLRGEPVPNKLCIQRDPFTIRADIKGGQKTGYFLDQVQNRKRFGQIVSGDLGIDVFCYTGGWGLEALQAGVDEVIFVDQSQEALRFVRENARLNGWNDRIKTECVDGIDYLNSLSNREISLDFVVLDPPAFAHSQSQKSNAFRGYKEINLRALQNLKPEGLLATSSCSASISLSDFRKIIEDSAHDAHVTCKVLEELGQPADHPWLVKLPSTKYLKCLLCKISLL